MPDQIIDAVMARALHADAVRAHPSVTWIIMRDQPDYPDEVVSVTGKSREPLDARRKMIVAQAGWMSRRSWEAWQGARFYSQRSAFFACRPSWAIAPVVPKSRSAHAPASPVACSMPQQQSGANTLDGRFRFRGVRLRPPKGAQRGLHFEPTRLPAVG
jgi:hypothetical protein